MSHGALDGWTEWLADGLAGVEVAGRDGVSRVPRERGPVLCIATHPATPVSTNTTPATAA